MTGTKMPPKKKEPQSEPMIAQKSVINGRGDTEAVANNEMTNKNGTTFLSFWPINYLESGPLRTAPRVGLVQQTTAKP